VLSHSALAGVPLLLLVNKSDIKGAAPPTEVREAVARGLGLHDSVSTVAAAAGGDERVFRALPCSALRAEGVREAVEWAVSAAKAHAATKAR
jgi:signal recognition particle receptor subunit beta